MSEKWYVRSTAGKVFGPIDLPTLQSWVRDGRVEPLAGISNDLSNWMLAPLKRELEMNWIVENNPGQFYGPTHRAVVDDLMKSGALSSEARFYLDEREARELRRVEVERQLAAKAITVEAEKKALADEKNALALDKNTQIAQLEKGMTAKQNQIADLVAQLAAKNRALAEKDQTIEAKTATITARDNALAEAEARLAAQAKKLVETEEKLSEKTNELSKRARAPVREWKDNEPVVPEVLSKEPPPSIARQAFGTFGTPSASALAELERRAEQEIAQMQQKRGVSSARRFFGLGGK